MSESESEIKGDSAAELDSFSPSDCNNSLQNDPTQTPLHPPTPPDSIVEELLASTLWLTSLSHPSEDVIIRTPFEDTVEACIAKRELRRGQTHFAELLLARPPSPPTLQLPPPPPPPPPAPTAQKKNAAQEDCTISELDMSSSESNSSSQGSQGSRPKELTLSIPVHPIYKEPMDGGMRFRYRHAVHAVSDEEDILIGYVNCFIEVKTGVRNERYEYGRFTGRKFGLNGVEHEAKCRSHSVTKKGVCICTRPGRESLDP